MPGPPAAGGPGLAGARDTLSLVPVTAAPVQPSASPGTTGTLCAPLPPAAPPPASAPLPTHRDCRQVRQRALPAAPGCPCPLPVPRRPARRGAASATLHMTQFLLARRSRPQLPACLRHHGTGAAPPSVTGRLGTPCPAGGTAGRPRQPQGPTDGDAGWRRQPRAWVQRGYQLHPPQPVPAAPALPHLATGKPRAGLRCGRRVPRPRQVCRQHVCQLPASAVAQAAAGCRIQRPREPPRQRDDARILRLTHRTASAPTHRHGPQPGCPHPACLPASPPLPLLRLQPPGRAGQARAALAAGMELGSIRRRCRRGRPAPGSR